jgi:hypothetical protein
VLYKKANTCLLVNIAALEAGSEDMDNYPDMNVGDVLDLIDRLQQTEENTDLRLSLGWDLDRYFDLSGGGYTQNGKIFYPKWEDPDFPDHL